MKLTGTGLPVSQREQRAEVSASCTATRSYDNIIHVEHEAGRTLGHEQAG